MTRNPKAISKHSVRRARWFRITVIALFVFAISMFGLRLKQSTVEQLSGLSTTDFFLSWCVISALVFVVIGVGWRRGQFGWRHFWMYPPYWFAMALGVVSGVALFSSQIAASGRDAQLLWRGLTIASLMAFVVLTMFVTFCGIAKWRSGTSILISESTAIHKNSITTLATPDFLRWITSDSPVRTPQYDLFDHAVIANRMFARLNRPIGRIPSQAVVGPVGCGKSTIGSLLASQIAAQAKHSMIFVRAEMWPYETARAAAEGILASIVSGLGREVSVIDIKGLPKQYGDLIARATGGINIVPSLLALGPKTPLDAIASIDKIALGINRRIVLWIEDLERFAPASGGVENGIEMERLAPIRALLYGLSRLQMVSVIVASTDLHYQFDIDKIADFVERVSVDKEDVATVLQRFRSEALHTNGLIKTYDEDQRKLDWNKDNGGSFHANEPADDMLRFGQAVTQLTLLPRTLKSGLRNALDAWDTLKGEIDPDELIALSLIKVAHPNIFAMIDRHVDSLRNQRRGRIQIDETDFMADLSRDSSTETTKHAIALIVDHMFVTNKSVQGIGIAEPTDYWKRFLSPIALVASVSDQSLLRLAADGDANALADAFEEPTQSSKLNQFRFVGPLSVARMLQCLEVIVQRRLREGAEKWPQVGPNGWPRAHGIHSVAMMFRGRAASSEMLNKVLASVQVAVPVNLMVVHELLRSFCVAVDNRSEAIDDSSLLQRSYQLIAAYYSDKPGELAAQVAAAPAQMLRWLFVVVAKDQSALAVPPPGWQDLSRTVLVALNLQPLIMAPAVAHLVTRRRQAYDDQMRFSEAWEFDVQCATELFGDAAQFLAVFKAAADGLDPLVAAGVVSFVCAASPGKLATIVAGTHTSQANEMKQ
jgi:hypothetical protein